jgi:hypothetical protein
MPTRRTTTTQPTPLEETEPTTPAPPAPAPSPAEPEPQPGPEPTAEELDEAAARRREAVAGGQAGVGALLAPLRGWLNPSTELTAAQREDYPLSVEEAIAEVTRRVDAIAKDRTATQGGSYRYRGIDDVFAALHPLLGDVGLVILPGKVVREQWETRATSSGGTLNVARLLVRYTLVGPDGSKLRGEAWGEGGDSGDKATQKAHSQSYKSFTLQLFSIPTEDSRADEPDATNEPARPFSRDEVERATRAFGAALEQDSVEGLASVRHRALALLAVPVLNEGQVAPLSWWIDQRRAELEGVTG